MTNEEFRQLKCGDIIKILRVLEEDFGIEDLVLVSHPNEFRVTMRDPYSKCTIYSHYMRIDLSAVLDVVETEENLCGKCIVRSTCDRRVHGLICFDIKQERLVKNKQ